MFYSGSQVLGQTPYSLLWAHAISYSLAWSEIMWKFTVVFENVGLGLGFLWNFRSEIFWGTEFRDWVEDNSLVENVLYDPVFRFVSFGGFVLENFRFGLGFVNRFRFGLIWRLFIIRSFFPHWLIFLGCPLINIESCFIWSNNNFASELYIKMIHFIFLSISQQKIFHQNFEHLM